MAADATFVRHRKACFDQRGQFMHHVVVHPVMLRPGHLRGVQIEAGAEAEIPVAIRVARHIGAARAGVGGNDDDAEFSCNALGTGK